jgi:hypothetical protein
MAHTVRGMCAIPWIASLVFAVGVLSAGTAASQSPMTENARVAIELGASTLMAPRQARTMIAEADAIWRPNGVSVVLSSPMEPVHAVVRLALAVESSAELQLSLRVTARSSTNDNRGLGYIWFNNHGMRGEAVFVNLDAVADTIRQTAVYGRSVDALPSALFEMVIARAAGRVLAHEIGHYLLAWPAHSGDGLMRAAFDGRELASSDRHTFTLDRMLLPRLRGLLARLERRRRTPRNA